MLTPGLTHWEGSEAREKGRDWIIFSGKKKFNGIGVAFPVPFHLQELSEKPHSRTRRAP